MATTARRRSLVGAKIGNYAIVSAIGEGGMGVVYLACHPVIGKQVAIKVLHADHADAAARCFVEARAVNDIHHANVVDVIDCGTADVPEHGAVHYLLMEYLEGRSLRAELADGPLATSRAIAIAIEVGRALEAAHAKGIVHRDIKPENIFLAGERVKVLDFGIAKLTDGTPFSGRLTQSGVALGTPQYMAPEQLDGEDVDGRADVYALGIVLYEMLCGSAPFADEPTARGVWRRMNEVPVFPRDVADSLPGGLEDLMMRAIDPDRVRRPEMAELVRALGEPMHALADDGDPHTQRLGRQPRPAKRRRRRWPIALAAAGAIGVAALAFVWTRESDSSPRANAASAGTPGTTSTTSPAAATSQAPSTAGSTSPITTIRVETVPAGAEVYVAAETAPRGTTPLAIELARTDAVEIRLHRTGFADLRRSIPALRDETYRFALPHSTPTSRNTPRAEALLDPGSLPAAKSPAPTDGAPTTSVPPRTSPEPVPSESKPPPSPAKPPSRTGDNLMQPGAHR